MGKQTALVIAGAVAIFVVALIASLAFVGGDDAGGTNVHTMPDGSTMTTPMHTMPDGATMTGMSHDG
ncbi:MAG TPA: hypothetical protein VM184_02470 [Gaiellaceae bacterium]|nr:hypothetical protein [Gaiellaceae bacterium]